MKKNKAVIFDFDGTIADTIEIAIHIYNDMCARYHCSPITDNSQLDILRSMGYREAFKSQNIPPWLVPIIVFDGRRRIRSRILDIPPFEGAAETLLGLKQKGYQVGILTSNNAQGVQAYAQKYHLTFDFVRSERSLFKKHKGLHKLAQEHDLDLAQSWYVGDEPRDIDAGTRAGIQTIGVTTGLAQQHIHASHPHHVANHLKEVLELVQ